MPKTGVILLGFGGPDSLDSVEPFMCNLMGRQPSDELVERVCRRYLTIGGKSPLLGIAIEMAEGIAAHLAADGFEVPVRVGMRYWAPFIDEAVEGLVAQGCTRIVTLSLSPFESKVAHGAYREALAAALESHPEVELIEAPLVSSLDHYVEFFAMSTAGALEELDDNQGAVLAFTAHSLPESDLVDADPYVAGLQSVAQQVAARLGLEPGVPEAGEQTFARFRSFGCAIPPRAWFLVYQSKGQKPGEWLGPQIEDLIDAAAATEASAIVVVPIGFATDHMETMYDLDVVAADRALLADLEFVRAAVPNADDGFLLAVADSIKHLL